MKMNMPDKAHKFIELTLWIAIITVLILLNLSVPGFASKENLLGILIIVVCAIITAFDRICSKRLSGKQRLTIELPIICLVILLIPVVYEFVALKYILFFTPLLLALSLSTLVVIETKWTTIGLVAATCFLLGDVYWGAEISKKGNLVFPVTFLRIFSLSLVILFGFYLYKNKDRALNELKELKNKLEARTKQLTNLNKRLKYLDNIKSEFISTVSHELRTPLAVIFNSAELIKKICQKKNIHDDEINDLIKTIRNNTDRQTNMVENLLNLSRIEKNKVKEKRKLSKIKDILEAAVNSLRPQAESKSIKFKLSIPSQLFSIWCVPDQIQRVFINLISNAIKYSPDNSDIIIKVIDEDDDMRCSVKDFGPGIKKENLVKVFDRFLQERIYADKTKGTGLGLSICKQIIQSHKGEIWAESKTGEGSTFIFTLPKNLRKRKRRENDRKKKNPNS
jgi:signal transduction histidine kinase